MRIALVHMRHARRGGAEYYLDSLAGHLAERGHAVEIVCRSHAEPPHPAVRFRVLHGLAIGGAWRMWGFARAVERHVARERYDLVFGVGKTWTQDVLWLGGGCQETYLALAHRYTLTATDHLLGERAFKHALAVRIERRALAPGAFELAITNSDMVRRDAQARHAIPDEKIVTVHNGVDLERFHPRLRAGPGAALRAELGFAADEPVVLFLGTGYARKGLDLLIEAFPALLARDPRSRLLVVGYDSARARFEQRASELGIAGRVTFSGGRPDPETWYAAADLYALPTRYDPAAYTTLEALASGVPVVTTAANGGAEVLVEREAGAVVEPEPEALAAALAALLLPEARARGAAAARACAELHSIGSKLARTTEVLEEVAAEGARQR